MKSLLLLVTLLPSIAHAEVALRANGGNVSFLAVGKPSMLKIHGKAENPEAKLVVDKAILSGTAEIDMEKFSTGIGLRDKHLKEKYLQTGQYPKARLTLKGVSVDAAFAETLSTANQPFEGVLSFHGKEQPVKGSFSAEHGEVNAKFPLKLGDFAVEVPSYLGVTVAETVDVEAVLPLVKE
jgi:polyisoprenoid-binding protein YceI